MKPPKIHDRRKGPLPRAAVKPAPTGAEAPSLDVLARTIAQLPGSDTDKIARMVWGAAAMANGEAREAAPREGVEGVLRVHEETRVRLRVLRQVADLHAEQEGHPSTCRKGCSACCYQLVQVHVFDVLRMALAIDRAPEPLRAELRARVADAAARTAGMDEEARWEARVPCPLLAVASGACQGYEARPSTCEGYVMSSDPAECGYRPGHEARTKQLFLPVLVAMAPWGAVEPLLRSKPLDTRPVEFIGALNLCLTDPGAIGRWLDGAPAFEAHVHDRAEASAELAARMGLVPGVVRG